MAAEYTAASMAAVKAAKTVEEKRAALIRLVKDAEDECDVVLSTPYSQSNPGAMMARSDARRALARAERMLQEFESSVAPTFSVGPSGPTEKGSREEFEKSQRK